MALTICLGLATVLIPEQNKGVIGALSMLKKAPDLIYPGPLRYPLSMVVTLAKGSYVVVYLALTALAAPIVLLLALGLGRGPRIQLVIAALIVVLSVGAEGFNRRTTDALVQAFVAKMVFERQTSAN